MTGTHMDITVMFPKEKRGGQRLMKVVRIGPHAVRELCPAHTCNAYRVRTSSYDAKVKHHKDPSVEILPLVRHCSIPSDPVSNDRISNHIDFIMQLILHDKKGPKLKARAVGATISLQKGISVDDVTIHGNWSSSDVVIEFYHLSRATAQNFANVVLDNSGATSIVSSERRTMDSIVEQSDD
ncbi:hypothetical protein BGX21_004963 [Mortierella sp. AD011]|nr:hypothetical protein BGX21_004963 [Mortierella sp. AD011]